MIQIDRVGLQYSNRLTDQIKAKIIAQSGKISFADYMQQILYTPGLGYYSAGANKIGPKGDFTTAPELGPIFAQCLATQIAEVLTELNATTILELGAGSGQLAVDILYALAEQGVCIEQYLILEVSADLRLRQQEKILQACPQFKDVVKWLDHLPQNINGVIFANEVLDAMPVARFNYAQNTLQEYYVSILEDQFALTLGKPSDLLQTTFTQYNIADYISQPYASEINLFLPAWINSLAACLNTGVVLFCDYGFSRAEYYHPQRNSGTLMCHYQHRCHPNALINIGLQDVTAHVDFTAVVEAAIASGLELAGYTNMASFLLNCDLTEHANSPSIQQAQEINTLTSPAEMGELFKWIGFLKGTELELRGFKFFDKSYAL